VPRDKQLELDLTKARDYADKLADMPSGREYFRVRPALYTAVAERADEYSTLYWQKQHGGAEEAMQHKCATLLGWLLHALDGHGASFEDVLWQTNLYTANQLLCISEDPRIPEVRRDRLFLTGLAEADPAGLCAVWAERALQIEQLRFVDVREDICYGEPELKYWCSQTLQELRLIGSRLPSLMKKGMLDTIQAPMRLVLEDLMLIQESLKPLKKPKKKKPKK
jgi:hypothetical protein